MQAAAPSLRAAMNQQARPQDAPSASKQEQPDSGKTPTPDTARPSPWRGRLIATGVALVLAAGAYAGGRIQGAMEVREVQKQAQAQREELERTITSLEADLAEAERTRVRLSAQLELYRARAAVEARNFGIAQDHIRSAAEMLAKHPTAKNEEVAELISKLKTANVVTPAKFEEQRDKVDAFATQLDELLGGDAS